MLKNYIITYRKITPHAEAANIIVAAIDCAAAKLYVEERPWCREIVEGRRYTDTAEADYIADFSRSVGA